jgi:hypothetical protein
VPHTRPENRGTGARQAYKRYLSGASPGIIIACGCLIVPRRWHLAFNRVSTLLKVSRAKEVSRGINDVLNS